MNPKTLFLFPTEGEAASFRTLCPDAAVAIIGVGMAEAAANVAVQLVAHDPERVVLCGIAGACDERLSVGQVVEVVHDSVEGLPEKYSVAYQREPSTGLQAVRTLTVNHSGDALRHEEIIHGPLPVVEQMEGMAVATMLHHLGFKNFIHIRAISNRVGEPFAQWRVGEAVKALAAVVAQMYKE